MNTVEPLRRGVAGGVRFACVIPQIIGNPGTGGPNAAYIENTWWRKETRHKDIGTVRDRALG